MIKVGDRVFLPTPFRDRVEDAGGDMGVLNRVERQMLPFEAELASEPGVVVSVEDGWAMVDRGSFGQFGHPVGALVRAKEDSEEGA